MKILIPIIVVFFCLQACKKEANLSPGAKPVVTVGMAAVKYDTIPDKALFKVKLFRDNVTYDETAISFAHTASLVYNPNVDSEYFMGFGQLSFASIAGDGRDLAQYQVPYKPGMSIRFDLHAKTNGVCHVTLSDESGIPSDIHIWLKDKYLKDSVDIRTANYSFNVNTLDTNSFGKNRLEVILK